MTKYKELIQSYLKTSAEVKEKTVEQCFDEIEEAGLICAETLGSGSKLLLCGNGGSAADAQHIATELVVRLSSRMDRKALPALALTVNSSTLTACANDYGFDSIFSRQVEAFGKPGDLLIGISTSGNSKNVVQALKIAEQLNMKRICFTGGDGGAMANLRNIAIIIPHNDTGHIQEGHITVGHIICDIIERELF